MTFKGLSLVTSLIAQTAVRHVCIADISRAAMLQPDHWRLRGGEPRPEGTGSADQSCRPLAAPRAAHVPRGQAARLPGHPADPHRATRGTREGGDRHGLQRYGERWSEFLVAWGSSAILGGVILTVTR